MNENYNQIKINVRLEDYDGIVYRHFCPYCMEEIEKSVPFEESSIECDFCKKIINLEWNTYITDIEDYLAEKIRYAIKASNAYDDDDAFCEALCEVIEEVYRSDDSEECYDVAQEVMEITRGYEDEHDIAKEIIELLDVPSFSDESYDDYDDDDYDDYDDSYDDDEDENY